MNTRQGIPLRPDYSGYERSLRDTDRRLVMRGFAAIAVATARGEHAEEVVRNLFPRDEEVARIVRNAVSPATSAGFPQLAAARVLPAIAPASASVRLFALGATVDLEGVGTAKLPAILTVPPAVFVEENTPAPVVSFAFNAPTIGPTKKVLIRPRCRVNSKAPQRQPVCYMAW